MLLMSGCSSFPKAPKLDFPENTEVTLFDSSKQIEHALNTEQSLEMIQKLEEMKPTRRQSIQDMPVQKIDYQIRLVHEREEMIYFYSENGKHYAELPYTGIYECSTSLYESLLDSSMINEVKKAVMINDHLYVCTDEIITEARCGVMDGIIYSATESYRYPSENDQSNFGTGYEYQIAGNGLIDVVIDGNWVRFKEQNVYSCIAEIIEMKDTVLLYPYVEDAETAEVRNIPEITEGNKMFEGYERGDTVKLTFRQSQKNGSIEVLQVERDNTLYQTAYKITDFISFNPVKIEIAALPNTEYSQTLVFENTKELGELMNALESIVVYDKYIEPRGAGKISFELRFFDREGNQIVIGDYSQVIVNDKAYYYRWTKTDNTLSKLLRQYFNFE